MLKQLYDIDTLNIRGATFRVRFAHDDSHGAPWEEDDGHGVVTGWERREAGRDEWVLSSDRHSRRFYNWRETLAIAKRDHWGLGEGDRAKLAANLGREPTARDIRKEAARRDFEYLYGWCSDQWSYIGVIVELLDGDGRPTRQRDSIWGVESLGNYASEVAEELANGILFEMDSAKDEAAGRD